MFVFHPTRPNKILVDDDYWRQKEARFFSINDRSTKLGV